MSRGGPDAAAPWPASTSTASIRPQPEDLEPRSAASIGTRHLGRRRRRRGKEGSSSQHLGRRRLDSMSWPRCFMSRKQLTVQADLLVLLLCWSGSESTDIRTQEIFSYED
ncbi:hypothetical protein VPH35_095957 [Triticum aestivum]